MQFDNVRKVLTSINKEDVPHDIISDIRNRTWIKVDHKRTDDLLCVNHTFFLSDDHLRNIIEGPGSVQPKHLIKTELEIFFLKFSHAIGHERKIVVQYLDFEQDLKYGNYLVEEHDQMFRGIPVYFIHKRELMRHYWMFEILWRVNYEE